ncbi:MAG: hypothetical protein U0N08_09630 [Oscillospiraceae bacterium]
MIASLDKSMHGFDGRKNAHAASKPLTIQQVFSAGFSLPEHFSALAKLRAPDGNGLMSDFWLLRCRWADAHQSEKAEKRLKDAPSGVYAIVKRCYGHHTTKKQILQVGIL